MKKRFSVWCVNGDEYNIGDFVEGTDFQLPFNVTKAQADKLCKLLNALWEEKENVS